MRSSSVIVCLPALMRSASIVVLGREGPHAEHAVLRLQRHVDVVGDVVRDQRRDADPEVHVHAVLELLGGAGGHLVAVPGHDRSPSSRSLRAIRPVAAGNVDGDGGAGGEVVTACRASRPASSARRCGCRDCRCVGQSCPSGRPMPSSVTWMRTMPPLRHCTRVSTRPVSRPVKAWRKALVRISETQQADAAGGVASTIISSAMTLTRTPCRRRGGRPRRRCG